MSTFVPDQARRRLLELVRERAFHDGVDVVLASGKRSTFYFDGKKITLHPEGLWLTARLMLRELEAFPEVRSVGGLAIGADPIAAALCVLSHESGRDLHAFLVRKEAKGHGLADRIAGEIEPGERVAVVEDTITTGGSARRAAEAVEAAGASVSVVLALVDRQDPDASDFRARYPVRALLTLDDVRGERHG